MKWQEAVNALISEGQNYEAQLKKGTEKNCEMFKVLATVKNNLEKCLKKPETLNQTVYECIDLLRQHTPYYSTNEGKTKVDPPLTDSEKNLP